MNSECLGNQACIGEKCRDPCPGSCGVNALCNVINHTPICTCINGFTGDPFVNCQPKPVDGKNALMKIFFKLILNLIFKYILSNLKSQLLIRVIQIHVDPMHNVMKEHAFVWQNTMETHILDAGLNVYLILTAIEIEHVYKINA